MIEAASHNSVSYTNFKLGVYKEPKIKDASWTYTVCQSGEVSTGTFTEGGTSADVNQCGSCVDISNVAVINHSREWLDALDSDLSLNVNSKAFFALNPDQLVTGNEAGDPILKTAAPATEMLMLRSTNCHLELCNFQQTNCKLKVVIYKARNNGTVDSPSDLFYAGATDINATTTYSTVYPPSAPSSTPTFGDWKYSIVPGANQTCISPWGNLNRGVRKALLGQWKVEKEEVINLEPGSTHKLNFTVYHNFTCHKDMLKRDSTIVVAGPTTYYGSIRGQTYVVCVEDASATPVFAQIGTTHIRGVTSGAVRVGYLFRKTYNFNLVPSNANYRFNVMQSTITNKDLDSNDIIQIIDAEDDPTPTQTTMT